MGREREVERRIVVQLGSRFTYHLPAVRVRTEEPRQSKVVTFQPGIEKLGSSFSDVA